MFTEINHIGLAVKDVEPWIEFLSKAFGMYVTRRINFPEMGQHSCMLALGEHEVFELMMPLNELGVIGKYLKTHGEGIHHISIKTDDIASEVKHLTELGVTVFGETVVEGQQMAFIHPKTSLGILYELAENKDCKPAHPI